MCIVASQHVSLDGVVQARAASRRTPAAGSSTAAGRPAGGGARPVWLAVGQASRRHVPAHQHRVPVLGPEQARRAGVEAQEPAGIRL